MHTATNTNATIAIMQAKCIRVKDLRNIQEDVELTRNKL